MATANDPSAYTEVKHSSIFSVQSWLSQMESTFDTVVEYSNAKTRKVGLDRALVTSISPAVPLTKLQRQLSTELEGDSFPCTTCLIQFEDAKALRVHAQTPAHVARMQGKPVPESDTSNSDDGSDSEVSVSGLTGSESEPDLEEPKQPDPTIYGSDKIALMSSVIQVELYKVLLAPSSVIKGLPVTDRHTLYHEKVPSLQNIRYTAVLLLSGGRFSGAIFDGKTVQVHKTFQKYVVRKKQGQMQVSKDASKGGIKSVGSQMRRQQYALYVTQVHNILQAWQAKLAQCQLIFIRAPGVHNKGIIFRNDKKKGPEWQYQLDKFDPRVRSIPIAVHKPIFSEVQRVFTELTTIAVGPALSALELHRLSNVKPTSEPAHSVKAVNMEHVVHIMNEEGGEDDEVEESPLLVAVREEDLKTARDLLEAKADVNAVELSTPLQTVLFIACQMEQPDIIALLLSYQADISIRDAFNKTCLYKISSTSRNAILEYANAHPHEQAWQAHGLSLQKEALMTRDEKTAHDNAKKQKRKEKQKRQKAAKAVKAAEAEKAKANPQATVESKKQEHANVPSASNKSRLSVREMRALALEKRLNAQK